jgi:Tat protein secretion system quality control protein TatD with DNase activity
VGLGELGLDAKRAGERGIAHQLRWMEAQLALACELGLPIVLHSVGAGQETLAVLRKVGVPRAGGIVHSFSGSPEQARQYRALGLTLSISAAVTRKGFERLKKAVVELPLEDLVVESDAPDQPPAGLDVGPAIPSPEGYKRVPTESRTPPENRPQAIWRTAEAIAELRNRAAGSGAAPLTAAQVLESSRNRLEKVFRL